MTLKSIGIVGDDALKALKKAKLAIVPRNGEVWVDDEDIGKAKEIIARIFEDRKLADQMFTLMGSKLRSQIPIEDRVVGASSEPSTNRSKVCVWYYSKPRGGLDVSDVPRNLVAVTIFQQKVELGAPCYTPAYRGVVLPDDQGLPLVEVTPFNVFVLFNVQRNAEATKRIFDAIIQFAVVIANHSDPKAKEIYDAIYKDQAPRRDERQLEAFTKMYSENFTKEIKQLESENTRLSQAIEAAHKTIFDNARLAQETGLRLEMMKNLRDGELVKKAKEEFEKLKKLDMSGRIRDLDITNDLLKFKTSLITWRRDPESDQIDLGEYEVQVGLKEFKFAIKNLTKTLEYEGHRWHHPHCQEGNLCYGNLTEAMPKFAARRDFEALIMCSLKWLGTVDVKDSWGARVEKWEKDHKERRKKEDEERRFREEKEAKERAEREKTEREKAEKAAPTGA